MSDSNSVNDLQGMQDKAQQQYLDLSMKQIENQMAAQQAQFAKEAAEAWSKAQ
jgi:hypothetical protein